MENGLNMKGTRQLFVIGLACLVLLVFCREASSADFGGWRYRQKITFSGYEKSGTLTNFPALVVLPDSVTNYLDNPNGYDLRFAATNGTDELNYEVEKWDPSTNSFVWVQILEISGTNTYIWAYFGRNSATSAPPVYATNGATWSSGFKGVWHMLDTNVLDSTSNGNDGDAKNGLITTNAGVSGNALTLNGSSQYADFGNGMHMGTNDATMNIWFRTSNSSFDAGIMGKSSYRVWDGRYAMYRSAATVGCNFDAVASTAITTTWLASYHNNSWHQLTATYDRSGNKTLYIDGIQKNSDSISGDEGFDMTSGDPFYIGAYGNTTGSGPQPGWYFPGELDEARLMTVPASSNWVWATWMNLASNDTFNSYGSVEAQELMHDWRYKVKITFSGYDKSETLTNFPALAVLSTNITDFDYNKFSDLASGGDLRIIDDAGTTEWYYEIENWDTNGSSYVWIRVPEFTNNVSAWVYFNNASETNAPAYTTNGLVWNDDYEGIWHLSETSGDHYDSTSNGWDAYPSNSVIQVATGKVDGANSFDGVNDGVVVGDIEMGTWSGLTVGAWYYSTGGGSERIVVKDQVGTLGNFIVWFNGSSQLEFVAYDTVLAGLQRATSSKAPGDASWHSAVGTVDTVANKIYLYLDGVRVASDDFTAATLDDSDNEAVVFGADADMSSLEQAFAGTIDEVRIADMARSSNWIWAAWLNVASNSSLATFGAVQDTAEGWPSIGDGGVSALDHQSATLDGNLISTGLFETVVSVYWGTNDEGTVKGSWDTNTYLGTNSQATPTTISASLSGLPILTTYYYRFYATNAGGDAWSPVGSFTTTMDISGSRRMMKVTFSGYDKGSTLTDFPALVVLNTNLTGFAYDRFASANAGDLRFANYSKTQELNYEIEKWNTNGNSVVWVQVPALSGTNTYVWAHWGNDTETNPPVGTTNGATWTDDYLGVWHMQSDTSAPDSTTNLYHGSEVGTVTKQVDALIGDANDFDRNNDYFAVPDSADFTLSGAYTIHAWINSDVSGDVWEGYFGTYTGGSAGFISTLRSTANNEFSIWTAGTWRYSGIALPDSSWKHVVYTRNGTAGRVYYDGKLVANISGLAGSNGGELQIGAAGTGWPANRFDGTLDEIRLSGIDRSSNWVWACWFNQASNDTFATYDDVTIIVPQNITVKAASAQNVTSNSATLRGELLSTGDAENPDTYFCWGPSDAGTSSTGSWPNVVYMGSSLTTNDTFSTNLTSFISGSNYTYRCYVTNSTGEDWSDDAITFTTIYLPVVTNLGAAFAQSNAVIRGQVLDIGEDAPNVWFYYWPDAGATSVVAKGVQSGYFSMSWTGLVASSSYHYTILASNQAGLVWTSTNDFTTTAPGAIRTWHVSLDGDDTLGLTWDTGFTNIHRGVAAASTGDTVMVWDGVYNVTSLISVASDLTIRSANGATSTTLARAIGFGSFGVFNLSHASALLDGLTVTNGYGGNGSKGAGVYMSVGTIRNCIIAQNKTWGNFNGSSYGSGIYMTGGLVEDSLITNNWTGASSGYAGIGYGGGIYMTAGTVKQCRIVGNSAKSSWSYNNGRGGGIYMTGGRLENSLICNNEGPGYGGGVVMAGGNARLLNCTVSDNTSYNDTGAGLYMTAGAVSNSIVYFNTRTYDQSHVNVNKSGGTMGYSCAIPFVAGTNNTLLEPDFVNRPSGDYHIRPGSPCLDTGVTLVSITNDIDGVGRPIDGDGVGGAAYDMGAYEEPDPASRDFMCNFTALTNDGVDSLTVVFTAYVYGPDTNNLSYWWDFTNDGSFDTNGVGLLTVTNTYGPGYHEVELVVSNAANGVTSAIKTDYIRVLATTNYIDVNGGHMFPYWTWANASTTVVAAVNAAIDGGTVLVSNGTYVANAVQLDRGIRMRGVNGASTAVISGGDRILISHSNAVLEQMTVEYTQGITMSDGTIRDCVIASNYYYSTGGGGGIRMTAGSVYRCSIIGNTNWASLNGSTKGGGVNMSGGIVSNCTIFGNWSGASISYGGRGNGGGVYMTGGTLMYCTIISNDTRSSASWEKGKGGGVWISGGTMLNCLIAGNAGPESGGGVELSGSGKVLNCTVAHNTTRIADSAGLLMSNGGVTNTIVYFNKKTSDQSTANVDKSGGTFSYSCTTPLEAGTNNISGEPDFVDSADLDYHLLPGSPCIDSGTNLVDIAYDLDYTNRPLDGDDSGTAIFDIGCYEALSPSNSPFQVNFTAPTNEGVDSLEAVFTAFVAGNTNGLYYWWDFENDGTNDVWGATSRVVTNNYGPGYFSVKLTVSNAIAEVTNIVKTDYVRILGSVTYVATNGGHVFPHATLSTAATNIQDAVNATPTGGVVVVTDGTFTMSAKLIVGKAITIGSSNGVAATTITGSYRIELNDAGLVFEKMKVTGTAGIYMTAGTIRDCIISNNYYYSTAGGGGIRMDSGLTERCVIRHNRTYASFNGSSKGGGVYMTGGTLRNCDIVGNESTASTSYAGAGNGGGVYMTGGSVESCTISGGLVNMTGVGGGLYRSGGTVINTIIWNNTNETTLVRSDLAGTYPAGFTYSCSLDLTNGVGNITGDPLFTDQGSGHGDGHVFGNYVPLKESPCKDVGTNQAWMVNEVDIASMPRLVWTVDIGAYEVERVAGTIFILR